MMLTNNMKANYKSFLDDLEKSKIQKDRELIVINHEKKRKVIRLKIRQNIKDLKDLNAWTTHDD